MRYDAQEVQISDETGISRPLDDDQRTHDESSEAFRLLSFFTRIRHGVLRAGDRRAVCRCVESEAEL